MSLDRVSATQVDAWKRCNRFWYHRYVLKLPEPKTAAQVRGSNTHKVVEHFLLDGVIEGDYECTQIANAGLGALQRLKVRRPGQVEHGFSLLTYPYGPKWVGFVDYHDELARPFLVVDHKTTSDFRYCKTPEELRHNTQMVSYARWAIEEYKVNEVEVRHLYLRTKKPYKSHEVPAIVDASHVADLWHGYFDDIRRMARWEAERPETAEPLEPTTTACSMYGGCAYRSQCGLSVKSFSGFVPLGRKTMAEGKRTLSEIMAARRVGQSTPPINGAAAQEYAKQTGVGEIPPGAGFAGVGGACGKAMPGGRKCGVDRVWCSDECMDASEELSKGVVPPDAPREEKAPPLVLTPSPAPEAAPEAKKGRRVGRPKAEVANGASSAATETPTPAAAAPAATASTESVPAPAVRSTSGDRPRSGLVIYVDCMPVKGAEAEPTLFEDFIRPFFDRIAETHGVPDARLIDFGKWKGPLLASLRERISEAPPVLVVSSYGSGVNEALETLIPYASKVVRRF